VTNRMGVCQWVYASACERVYGCMRVCGYICGSACVCVLWGVSEYGSGCIGECV